MTAKGEGAARVLIPNARRARSAASASGRRQRTKNAKFRCHRHVLPLGIRAQSVLFPKTQATRVCPRAVLVGEGS